MAAKKKWAAANAILHNALVSQNEKVWRVGDADLGRYSFLGGLIDLKTNSYSFCLTLLLNRS